MADRNETFRFAAYQVKHLNAAYLIHFPGAKPTTLCSTHPHMADTQRGDWRSSQMSTTLQQAGPNRAAWQLPLGNPGAAVFPVC